MLEQTEEESDASTIEAEISRVKTQLGNYNPDNTETKLHAVRNRMKIVEWEIADLKQKKKERLREAPHP